VTLPHAERAKYDWKRPLLAAGKEKERNASMTNKKEVLRRMCQTGVLPVFRTEDMQNLLLATRAFYDAGIGCVEYTMTMPDVLAHLREASASLPMDLFLGIGTVLDGRTVDAAVDAGAQFVASPGCNAEMVEACKHRGVVSVVGVMTPTEIMEAVRLGADVLKVFPAGAVSPEFFGDVLGPFPGLHLMAAGKSVIPNLAAYIEAGAEIVTLLANGLDAEAYAIGDSAAITRAAKQCVEAVRAARQAKSCVASK
jgi:2-dehydro-3-deoxyphosphogluconate aldolase / (4S)-4-hydroxy-2-oxoglutarate aldolase